MALAGVAYEVRISEVLAAAAAPMTAGEIQAALRASFRMTSVGVSDINSSLFSTRAYQSVGAPPRWYLPGSPAAAVAAEATAAASAELYSRRHIPPPDIVPPDEFAGRAVVVGGEAADLGAASATVALLLQKSAAAFLCLSGQPAGEAAMWAAGVVGASAVEVTYAGGDLREGIVHGHRRVFEGNPACLVLVGPVTSSDFATTHILAAFETRGLPVYLVRTDPAGAPPPENCAAC